MGARRQGGGSKEAGFAGVMGATDQRDGVSKASRGVQKDVEWIALRVERQWNKEVTLPLLLDLVPAKSSDGEDRKQLKGKRHGDAQV